MMARHLWACGCLLWMACPAADNADNDTRLPRASDASASRDVSAMQEAQGLAKLAPEIIAAATISDAEDAPEATPHDGARGASGAASAIIWDAATGLGFVGLPGVSADGMHVAIIDRQRGRVALQVRRLDGEVLVEKVLIEASEAAAAEGDTAVQRRVRGRALGAQKVLRQAGMRGLEERRDALSESHGQLVAKVRGFETLTLDKQALPGCERADVATAFVDPEYGVVLLNVVPGAECATGQARAAWQILTLNAAP